MANIGVFLDRDGTINEEVDYLTSPDEIRIIPRSDVAIRDANNLGYKVVVITNQSGVGRGYLTEDRLDEIHNELIRRLDETGARVDRIYYCPHHPGEGQGKYATACDCRKPATGMMEQASRDLDIDLGASFVVGDRVTDIEMANRAGAGAVLVLTGYGRNDLELCRRDGIVLDYVADDLYHAVKYIASHKRTSAPPA